MTDTDSEDEWHHWAAIDARPVKSGVPWKRSMGQVCPHGLQIFLVNGSHIRNEYDSDFDQGGNGWCYRFVPKGEIWIDDHVPEEEQPYVALHECREAYLMKEHGWGYNRAHAAAKRLENKFRREGHPGEKERP